MHSYELNKKEEAYYKDVLILVLMEDALVQGKSPA